jgi:hypothetical protein
MSDIFSRLKSSVSKTFEKFEPSLAKLHASEPSSYSAYVLVCSFTLRSYSAWP